VIDRSEDERVFKGRSIIVVPLSPEDAEIWIFHSL